MKNILKKIIAVYVIIASLAILLKIGDVYAEQVGDFPNQLCTRLSEDMIYGSTDQSASGQVTSLQRFLVNRGYSIGSDTFGIFGYGTQDAVSKFQTNSNLIPTGFVGENTRTVIQNISCGTTPYSNLPSTVQVSNIPNNVCGVNTGWTWNGRECVSLCDINHPWDPNQSKCSTFGNSNYTYYTPNSTSCAGYGPNYFFNGRYCVTSSNMNYCGTDSQYTWNGSSCVERYTTQYLCATNGQYYTNQNLCPASVATSSNNAYGYNGFAGYQYSSYGSTYTNTTPVTNNTTYTFVPTYSSYNSPAYYLGNNNSSYIPNNTPCQDWYPCQKEKPGVSITQYVYTYTTTSYPSYYNNYPNYNYLGSTGSQYYNDYFNCDYNQYINTGYYDIYGIYHY